MAKKDVKKNEPDELLDPADEGVAHDEGPEADDESQDESAIEDSDDAEELEKEEALPRIA